MAKSGQPKKFKNGDELIDLFDEFCKSIASRGYKRIPSQTEFCRWLEKHFKAVDRRTIYNSLNKYFPDIKSDFERLQSDLIAQGGMLGKYQSTMSIFVLKNWCKWSDKPVDNENGNDEKIVESIERLTKIISTPTQDRKVEDFE